MALTSEQKAALKADILANTDQAVIDGLSNGDSGAIAAWYNVTASPNFYIWRSNVTQDEIMQNGFDWVRVDNLSVGKARIWDWMFNNAESSINPSKPNVRQGIIEIWKGTAADLAVREAVWLHCEVLATRVQKLLSTGSGTAAAQDGTGPGTTSLDGDITYNDVSSALQS